MATQKKTSRRVGERYSLDKFGHKQQLSEEEAEAAVVEVESPAPAPRAAD